MTNTTSSTLATAATAASSAQVASSSTAERVAVVQQIASQIEATPPAGAPQTVTLNLHPDHWGQLTITLTSSASPDSSTATGASGASSSSNAGVTATIVAQTNAVRDALMGQTQDLKNTLSSAGVKLDKIDIVVANQTAAAPPRASAETGFGANSQSGGNSSGQQQTAQHGQSATASSSSGQQGQQRSAQQFASMFDGGQSRGGWTSAPASPASSALEDTSSTASSTVQASARGIDILA